MESEYLMWDRNIFDFIERSMRSSYYMCFQQDLSVRERNILIQILLVATGDATDSLKNELTKS